MRVKIFNLLDSGLTNFEDRINRWMAKNEVEIFKVLQSESVNEKIHYITITIFYRKAE